MVTGMSTGSRSLAGSSANQITAVNVLSGGVATRSNKHHAISDSSETLKNSGSPRRGGGSPAKAAPVVTRCSKRIAAASHPTSAERRATPVTPATAAEVETVSHGTQGGVAMATRSRKHHDSLSDPPPMSSVICSRLHSRSEEDDGYCSRSSLDSPVQISSSRSDSDTEVFVKVEEPCGGSHLRHGGLELSLSSPDGLSSTESVGQDVLLEQFTGSEESVQSVDVVPRLKSAESRVGSDRFLSVDVCDSTLHRPVAPVTFSNVMSLSSVPASENGADTSRAVVGAESGALKTARFVGCGEKTRSTVAGKPATDDMMTSLAVGEQTCDLLHDDISKASRVARCPTDDCLKLEENIPVTEEVEHEAVADTVELTHVLPANLSSPSSVELMDVEGHPVGVEGHPSDLLVSTEMLSASSGNIFGAGQVLTTRRLQGHILTSGQVLVPGQKFVLVPRAATLNATSVVAVSQPVKKKHDAGSHPVQTRMSSSQGTRPVQTSFLQARTKASSGVVSGLEASSSALEVTQIEVSPSSTTSSPKNNVYSLPSSRASSGSGKNITVFILPQATALASSGGLADMSGSGFKVETKGVMTEDGVSLVEEKAFVQTAILQIGSAVSEVESLKITASSQRQPESCRQAAQPKLPSSGTSAANRSFHSATASSTVSNSPSLASVGSMSSSSLALVGSASNSSLSLVGAASNSSLALVGSTSSSSLSLVGTDWVSREAALRRARLNGSSKSNGAATVSVQDGGQTAAAQIGRLGSLSLRGAAAPSRATAVAQTARDSSAASRLKVGATAPVGVGQSSSARARGRDVVDSLAVVGGSRQDPRLLRKTSVDDLTHRLHPLIDHDYCEFAAFSADIQSSIIATTDSSTRTERRYAKKSQGRGGMGSRATAKGVRLAPQSIAVLDKGLVAASIVDGAVRPTSLHVDGSGRLQSVMSAGLTADRTRSLSVSAAADARQKRKYKKKPDEIENRPSTNLAVTKNPTSISTSSKSKSRKGTGAPAFKHVSSVAMPTKGGADKATASISVSSVTSGDGDRRYVKIPGHYQDEFVYYATKRALPGTRLRKRAAEAETNQSSTLSGVKPSVNAVKAPVGGINVFDWYKEMALTDKSTRFGVALPAAELRKELSDHGSIRDDRTPLDESDVADLVMDLLPTTLRGFAGMSRGSGGFTDLVRESFSAAGSRLEYAGSETGGEGGSEVGGEGGSVATSSGEFDAALHGSSLVDSFLSVHKMTATSVSGDAGVGGVDDVSHADLNVMAEEVCLMLNSMNEAELKMLASHLSVATSADRVAATSATASTGSAESQSVGGRFDDTTQSSSNLMDVDEINDGDLLSADLTNMTGILQDLSSTPGRSGLLREPGSAEELASVAGGSKASANLSELFDTEYYLPSGIASGFDGFAPRAATAAQPTRVLPAALENSSVPELTTVNMFWNELPGLMLNGREHVRLVDIHKQIMPAKDTGILKKRCLMMGLDTINCTELQRDFLVRYMNAAKSKSTVVIEKDAAMSLIGFYVNPKGRPGGDVAVRGEGERVGVVRHELAEEEECVDEYSEVVISGSGGVESEGYGAERMIVKSGSMGGGMCGGLESGGSGAEGHTQSVRSISESCSSVDLSSPTSSATDGGNVKRSQRLRSKQINYSDMVHGTFEKPHSANHSRDKHIQDRSPSASCIDSRSVEVQRRGSDQENSVGQSAMSHGNAESSLVSGRAHEAVRTNNAARYRTVLQSSVLPETNRSPHRSSVDRRARRGRSQRVGRVHNRGHPFRRVRDLIKWKRMQKRIFHSAIKADAAVTRADAGQSDGSTGQHRGLASDGQWTPAKVYQLTVDSSNTNEKVQIRTSLFNKLSSSSRDDDDVDIQPSVALDNCSSPSMEVKGVDRFAEGKASETLAIVHRDVVCRSDRRRRSQEGVVHLDLYTSANADCVRCRSCNQLMSVQSFMRHLHWRGSVDRLAVVTVPQRLVPCGGVRSSATELDAWRRFTGLQGKYGVKDDDGMKVSRGGVTGKHRISQAHLNVTVSVATTNGHVDEMMCGENDWALHHQQASAALKSTNERNIRTRSAAPVAAAGSADALPPPVKRARFVSPVEPHNLRRTVRFEGYQSSYIKPTPVAATLQTRNAGSPRKTVTVAPPTMAPPTTSPPSIAAAIEESSGIMTRGGCEKLRRSTEA